MSIPNGSLSHLRPVAEMLIANATRTPPPPPPKPGMPVPAAGSWNDSFELSAERSVMPPVTYPPPASSCEGDCNAGAEGAR